MQDMDWSDLQVFLAIAQTGGLGRAGAALRVDATTVGRRLRRLEARVGANLFEQTREGQVLTDAGEALLLRVERMSRAAAEIGEGTQGRPAKVSGTLRISVAEGFGSWVLARHLPDFARAHPGLTVDLVANSGFLSMSKREADIAVMLSRPKAGPIIAGKLSDYALGLYASQTYLAAAGTPQRGADLLAGHSLIGYIPDLLYAPELRYLDEIHPGPTPRLRSSSINAQHQLIAGGAGIGVLPCFIGNADPSLSPVLPDKRIFRAFWMVTHKDTHQLARVQAGKDWIVAMIDRCRGLLLPRS
ncbi:LysR family transcriptional regulator [Tsuneonella sp. YG55]|uniref:LysR family transcriptional regulator n=1 Tax=Tsuneonella litorea TaxID=2976475 RepID=A0A9X2W2B7_9SPHN|nr:LysR family transcriptional regulator [Tsuneonella litorea]MCT2559703.1 LysR family transcriptional regulator [Tsuneonella litorea]